MTLFYDHIILIHQVHHEVELLPIESAHKQELIDLIEETIHHRILKKILDLLHYDHHEDFLTSFHQAPEDESLLHYLKEHIPDIEHHIKTAAEEVKYQLLKDIRSV